MASFAFGFPTQPQPTNPYVFGLPQTGGINPSSGNDTWYGQLFNWANLGAQTYLADQAINSPRPATVTYAPNGQLQTVGSGAAAVAVPGTLGSIPGWVWIVLGIVVILSLFGRR